MDYQTFPASPDLEGLIKCFWTLKVPLAAPKEKQQILPDGCIEMIFTLGDDIKRYTSDRDFIIQPRTMILGQITKPLFIEPMGLVETFAVRFYPGGFAFFSDISIDQLTNRETELSTIFEPQQVDRLEGEIIAAGKTSTRIEIIEHFLLNRLQAHIDLDHLVKNTIDLIFATKGGRGIHELLETNRNKRRSLERKFARQVGVSPKQLCRIIRLQTILQTMLHKKDQTLTSIGYENQYFDQSHFIKDFKNFTGSSPKELYKDPSLLLSSTIYGHN